MYTLFIQGNAHIGNPSQPILLSHISTFFSHLNK